MEKEGPDRGLLGDGGGCSKERVTPVCVRGDEHVRLPGWACIAGLAERMPSHDHLQTVQKGFAGAQPAHSTQHSHQTA